MVPDKLAALRDPLHALPFTSADFRYVVKKAKLKRAADALGWRADIIKQLNSEAINAICKLCARGLQQTLSSFQNHSSDHISWS